MATHTWKYAGCTDDQMHRGEGNLWSGAGGGDNDGIGWWWQWQGHQCLHSHSLGVIWHVHGRVFEAQRDVAVTAVIGRWWLDLHPTLPLIPFPPDCTSRFPPPCPIVIPHPLSYLSVILGLSLPFLSLLSSYSSSSSQLLFPSHTCTWHPMLDPQVCLWFLACANSPSIGDWPRCQCRGCCAGNGRMALVFGVTDDRKSHGHCPSQCPMLQ